MGMSSSPSQNGLLLLTGMYSYKAFVTILLQNKLIYVNYWPFGCRSVEAWPSPSQYGFHNHQNLKINTPDGCSLAGWYFPPQNRIISKPQLVVVYFHGNAGHIGLCLSHLKLLSDISNAGIIAVSYRGYGLSTGTPTESGLKLDAESVYQHAKTSFPAIPMVVYGHSLGGAVALYLASCHSEIQGVIVENSFTSIRDVVLAWYPKYSPYPYITWALWNRWDSVRSVQAVSPAVWALFLSGDHDETIPPKLMRLLYEAALKRASAQDQSNPQDRTFYEQIPNGLHNDTWTRPAYRVALDKYFAKLSSQQWK
eukprot:Sdes_comp20621_c0_seq15m15727